MDRAWRLRRGWLRLPSVEKKLNLFLGFTTRSLGDMKDPRAFSRALTGAGLDPARWAGGQQVHSPRVRWVSAPSRATAGSPATDGTATARRGLALRAHAADCAAVYIIDGAGRGTALVHAGWRGTVKSILSRAVRLLAAKTGARPRDLWIALGPCIRDCCYEVGAEVADQFRNRPGAVRRTPSGRFFLDLPRALAVEAARAGVPARQIFAAPPCTFCHTRFFSFRRNKTAKRCAAVLVRRNSGL